MDPGELFRQGRLADGITLLNEEVRKHPTDADRRSLLAVLLCFSGNLERADRQLSALATQDPEASMGVALMRQLVRAEEWRQQFHKEGRVPEFLRKPGERAALHLRASVLERDGDLAEAAQLIDQAEEGRPPLEGESGGERFDDFRDLDDLTASFLEVLTSTGKFYWVPMEDIIDLQFHEPRIPRDLLWRRCTMRVHDGPQGDVYIPTVYAPASEEMDEELLLGRATDWVGGDGRPVRGRGLRTFLVDEGARTILELGELSFSSVSRPEGGS